MLDPRYGEPRATGRLDLEHHFRCSLRGVRSLAPYHRQLQALQVKLAMCYMLTLSEQTASSHNQSHSIGGVEHTT